jgi:hypothetical protein
VCEFQPALRADVLMSDLVALFRTMSHITENARNLQNQNMEGIYLGTTLANAMTAPPQPSRPASTITWSTGLTQRQLTIQSVEGLRSWCERHSRHIGSRRLHVLHLPVLELCTTCVRVIVLVILCDIVLWVRPHSPESESQVDKINGAAKRSQQSVMVHSA